MGLAKASLASQILFDEAFDGLLGRHLVAVPERAAQQAVKKGGCAREHIFTLQGGSPVHIFHTRKLYQICR